MCFVFFFVSALISRNRCTRIWSRPSLPIDRVGFRIYHSFDVCYILSHSGLLRYGRSVWAVSPVRTEGQFNPALFRFKLSLEPPRQLPSLPSSWCSPLASAVPSSSSSPLRSSSLQPLAWPSVPPTPNVEVDGSFNTTDATGSRPLFAGAKVSCGSGRPMNICSCFAVLRVYSKRATFNGCTPDMQSQLNAAAGNAQSLAANASVSISSDTPWYSRCFGAYNASRLATVQNHFRSISDGNFSSFTYDCNCTDTGYFTTIGSYLSQS